MVWDVRMHHPKPHFHWVSSSLFSFSNIDLRTLLGARSLLFTPQSLCWPSFFIDARDLAIEHGGFNLQMFRDPGGEFGKAAKDVPVAGDQLGFAVLNVCQCAESVDLQLVQILVRVERFRTAGKPHRAWVWSMRHDYKSVAVSRSVMDIRRIAGGCIIDLPTCAILNSPVSCGMASLNDGQYCPR
jgi:hypothetical protein